MILAAFIAAAYVSWPNLAKPLGIKPSIVTFLVVAIAMAVIVLTSGRDIFEVRTLTGRAIFIIAFFSIINGLAIFLHANTAADPKVQTGIFLVTLFLFQVCFAPIADWLITGAKPSFLQSIGLGLALPVMWLLSQSSR